MMQEKFVLFGATHWMIFAATAFFSILVIWIVKKFPPSARGMNCTLAAILGVNKLVTVYLAWQMGNLSLKNGLPMHLCDWATFTTMIVLLWRNQSLYEVSYYWGLAGTIQALLTPDLRVGFDDLRFYTFFISHSGIIIVILYLTIGLKMRPTKFSVLKTFAFTQFYFAFTGFVNWLIGANYGYLCAKPKNPSLLDYLGPWPWYIVSVEIIALALFTLCYLPFWKRQKS